MTRRIISVLVALVMVISLIPISAQAKEGAPYSRSGGSVKSGDGAVVTRTTLATYDFETEPSDWAFIDSDGDGFNWEWQEEYPEDDSHFKAYQGEGMIFSGSYDRISETPLSPDNWAIMPAVEIPAIGATLSFWAAGQDWAFYEEHYAVYAGTSNDIGSMQIIMEEAVTDSEYIQNVVDLSGFAGETIYIAIRHFNTYDMFYLDIDFVQIYDADGPDQEQIDLPEGAVYGCYFETEHQIEGWSTVDADGDGRAWEFFRGTYSSEGYYSVASRSYYSGPLDPDNWLIAPLIRIPDVDARLTFYSANYSSTWADRIAVYISEATDSIEDFVQISSVITPSNAFEQEEFDLSAYAGKEVFIAIRHFDSYDNLEVFVDEFVVWGSYSIDRIEIDGFTAPEFGEAPDNEVSVNENADYTLQDAQWGYWNDSEDVFVPMAEDAVFDNEALDYCQRFIVVPKKNYVFAEDVDVRINSGAVNVGSFGWDEDLGAEVICSETFNVEEPVVYSLDDALNAEGSELHFETSENYPWFVVNDRASGRIYAMSGNAGVHRSTSSVWTTVEVGYCDTVSFDFKAWGETTYNSVYDECDFLVDGTLVFRYGAYDNDWETFTYVFMEAGEHTLTWTYTKDSSTHPAGDYFALDEVCLAEAIMPESITVEHVDIARGCFADAEYTVAPEGAPESVIFSIENENIATVDPDGRIYGKSAGTTYLTVTSAVDDSVYGTGEITVTEDPDYGVQFFGQKAISDNGAWLTFNEGDPSNVTLYSTTITMMGAAYYDGCVYGYSVNTRTFCVLDADTFEVLSTGAAAPGNVLSMAYNYHNDTMYALIYNANGTSSIATCDLETGETTVIGVITGVDNIPFLMAIDGDGAAYIITFSEDIYDESYVNKLYGVDLDSCQATLIGSVGTGIECYTQSMTWDMNTGRLFWARYDDYNNGLYEIDPSNGATTWIGTIGPGRYDIAGLYTRYDPASNLDVIESVDILDFAVPEFGEEPFRGVTVPEDAHYSIVFNDWYWYTEDDDGQMGEGELFDNEDCFYYQFFRLIPEKGYTFSEDTVVTIDGSDEYVASTEFDPVTGRLHVITSDFAVRDIIEIHEVYVNGWGSPESGVAGIDHVFLETPEGDPYYIIYGGWRDETDQQQMLTDEHVFIPGHMYSEGAQIWAEEGYVFADDCVFYADNGTELLDTQWCYVDEEDNTICYINIIPVMCIEEIGEIIVDGYEYPPFAGHDSNDWLNLSVPEDAVYYVDFDWTTWYDEDAMMDFSGPFETGTEYSVATVVQLPEGYVFGEEVTILLNGDTEILSDHVYVYEDHILFYTIPFLCRMWGDADGDGELTTVDALLIMRYSLGLSEIDEYDLDPWCDVNGDGAWDFTDALLIARKVLGVIDWFPAEERG